MNSLRTYGGLTAWILICFMAASIAAWFEPGIWYESLNFAIFQMN